MAVMEMDLHCVINEIPHSLKQCYIFIYLLYNTYICGN